MVNHRWDRAHRVPLFRWSSFTHKSLTSPHCGTTPKRPASTVTQLSRRRRRRRRCLLLPPPPAYREDEEDPFSSQYSSWRAAYRSPDSNLQVRTSFISPFVFLLDSVVSPFIGQYACILFLVCRLFTWWWGRYRCWLRVNTEDSANSVTHIRSIL